MLLLVTVAIEDLKAVPAPHNTRMLKALNKLHKNIPKA